LALCYQRINFVHKAKKSNKRASYTMPTFFPPLMAAFVEKKRKNLLILKIQHAGDADGVRILYKQAGFFTPKRDWVT